MNGACSHCKQNFEPEPGFYYGAMFISYAISVLLLLPPTLLLVFYFKWSFGSAMSFMVFLNVIFFLKILRVSRSLWIHFVVPFDANK